MSWKYKSNISLLFMKIYHENPSGNHDVPATTVTVPPYRTYALLSRKAQHDFPKMRGGGGQRPFGTFPKIHQFWRRHPSLRDGWPYKNG